MATQWRPAWPHWPGPGTRARNLGLVRSAGMEAQLARLQDEAVELQESLAEDIEDIRAKWATTARDGVESKAVRLERNDIGVVRFGVLWVPVTRSF